MKSEIATAESSNGSGLIFGTAALVRLAFEERDLAPIWNGLVARVAANPFDAAALIDMSVILQTLGQKENGLELQRAALRIQRFFERAPRGDGLRILVFMTAGDLMANTPIDFLLEGSDATLLMAFVDADTADLHDVPKHDVAFVAVAESEANRPVLERLKLLLAGWTGPIMNNAPDRIMALTRDGVAAAVAAEPSILAPATVRADPQSLLQVADGTVALAALLPGAVFPIIVRPTGTHAGDGMEKIENRDQLAIYLEGRAEQQFYLVPFIDYSGPDGLFRKQRIALINGRPFASHWATSQHWMVHYLSANMKGNEARRLEEAAWMRDFEADFAVRHAAAFEALYRCIGLDYFAIDCAEMQDGRLLLFEADVAMIVHAMDSETTFPYKKPAMRKLFSAFQEALQHRSGRAARVS